MQPRNSNILNGNMTGQRLGDIETDPGLVCIDQIEIILRFRKLDILSLKHQPALQAKPQDSTSYIDAVVWTGCIVQNSVSNGLEWFVEIPAFYGIVTKYEHNTGNGDRPHDDRQQPAETAFSFFRQWFRRLLVQAKQSRGRLFAVLRANFVIAPEIVHLYGAFSSLPTGKPATCPDSYCYYKPHICHAEKQHETKRLVIMAELQPGDTAPDFSLPRDGGGKVALADFKGKKVVLYFYPKDSTEGCTIQAVDFTTFKDEFAKLGAIIIGMSPDSVKRHDNFVKKQNLDIILASDFEQKVLESYGVWQEKSMYGRKYMGVQRTTYLIGEDGRIEKAWTKVKARGHAEEVLEELRKAG